jgi:hypothetical protein
VGHLGWKEGRGVGVEVVSRGGSRPCCYLGFN